MPSIPSFRLFIAMRRCLLLTALLILATAAAGCIRTPRINTFSRVCASISPVRFDTRAPLRVESSAPVRIEAQMLATGRGALEENVVRPASSGSRTAKIAVLDVDGLLVNQELGNPLTGCENPVAIFREKLNRLRVDSEVRAVVLRINSPGGGVTASDIMLRDLQAFIDETDVPLVACIMDVGTGGAYYLATAAHQIVAHPTSIVGGIGVILNLYNLEDALNQFNIVGVPVKSGRHVDLGSPLRTIPEDSRAILQDIADEFHDRFGEVVRASRPTLSNDDELFDGRVWTAGTAEANGLIDTVGYLEDAIAIAEQLGRCQGAAVIMLQRPPQNALTEYDVRGYPHRLLALPHFPGLDRSQMPTFLYIWQPDPAITSVIGH